MLILRYSRFDRYTPNVSNNKDFPNDIRATLEHMFAVLAAQAVKVDWTSFFLRHVVTTLHSLLRIYRITELQLLTKTEYVSANEVQRELMLKDEL